MDKNTLFIAWYCVPLCSSPERDIVLKTTNTSCFKRLPGPLNQRAAVKKKRNYLMIGWHATIEKKKEAGHRRIQTKNYGCIVDC
jgi:hypothetical protein